MALVANAAKGLFVQSPFCTGLPDPKGPVDVHGNERIGIRVVFGWLTLQDGNAAPKQKEEEKVATHWATAFFFCGAISLQETLLTLRFPSDNEEPRDLSGHVARQVMIPTPPQ